MTVPSLLQSFVKRVQSLPKVWQYAGAGTLLVSISLLTMFSIGIFSSQVGKDLGFLEIAEGRMDDPLKQLFKQERSQEMVPQKKEDLLKADFMPGNSSTVAAAYNGPGSTPPSSGTSTLWSCINNEFVPKSSLNIIAPFDTSILDAGGNIKAEFFTKYPVNTILDQILPVLGHSVGQSPPQIKWDWQGTTKTYEFFTYDKGSSTTDPRQRYLDKKLFWCYFRTEVPFFRDFFASDKILGMEPQVVFGFKNEAGRQSGTPVTYTYNSDKTGANAVSVAIDNGATAPKTNVSFGSLFIDATEFAKINSINDTTALTAYLKGRMEVIPTGTGAYASDVTDITVTALSPTDLNFPDVYPLGGYQKAFLVKATVSHQAPNGAKYKIKFTPPTGADITAPDARSGTAFAVSPGSAIFSDEIVLNNPNLPPVVTKLITKTTTGSSATPDFSTSTPTLSVVGGDTVYYKVSITNPKSTALTVKLVDTLSDAGNVLENVAIIEKSTTCGTPNTATAKVITTDCTGIPANGTAYVIYSYHVKSTATNGTVTNTAAVKNADGSTILRNVEAQLIVGTGFQAGFTIAQAPVSGGVQATFTNTSTGTTGATTYLWNFGDPNSGANNTATTPNATHTYTTPGTYTVTLTITEPGKTSTVTQTITIGTGVSCSLTANPDTIISNDPLSDIIFNELGRKFNWTSTGAANVVIKDEFGNSLTSATLDLNKTDVNAPQLFKLHPEVADGYTYNATEAQKTTIKTDGIHTYTLTATSATGEIATCTANVYVNITGVKYTSTPITQTAAAGTNGVNFGNITLVNQGSTALTVSGLKAVVGGSIQSLAFTNGGTTYTTTGSGPYTLSDITIPALTTINIAVTGNLPATPTTGTVTVSIDTRTVTVSGSKIITPQAVNLLSTTTIGNPGLARCISFAASPRYITATNSSAPLTFTWDTNNATKARIVKVLNGGGTEVVQDNLAPTNGSTALSVTAPATDGTYTYKLIASNWGGTEGECASEIVYVYRTINQTQPITCDTFTATPTVNLYYNETLSFNWTTSNSIETRIVRMSGSDQISTVDNGTPDGSINGINASVAGVGTHTYKLIPTNGGAVVPTGSCEVTVNIISEENPSTCTWKDVPANELGALGMTCHDWTNGQNGIYVPGSVQKWGVIATTGTNPTRIETECIYKDLQNNTFSNMERTSMSIFKMPVAVGGGYKTQVCLTDVTNKPITRIKVTPPLSSVAVNGTVQLTAHVYPINTTETNKNVTWTSASNLATVNNSGLVTGVTATGDTGVNITATSAQNNSISGNATVLVSDATLTPPKHSVIVIVPEGSHGTVSPLSKIVLGNTNTASFTITPDLGFTPQLTPIGCTGSLSGSTYTTGPITQDCVISAFFVPSSMNTYTVTPSVGLGGSITPSTPQIVNSGSSTSFTATANSLYQFVNFTGTCLASASNSNPISVTPTTNCSLSTNFCAQEGGITSGHILPEIPVTQCCTGLQGVYGAPPNVADAGNICYVPSKGIPTCSHTGTLEEGWYYPSPNNTLLKLGECDGNGAGSPDLIVESVTLPNRTFSLNETVTIDVTVKNNGPVAVGQQGAVVLIKDCAGILIPPANSKLTIHSPIASNGGTGTIQFTGTVQQLSGSCTAEVDPDHTVTESNEANNTKTITYGSTKDTCIIGGQIGCILP